MAEAKTPSASYLPGDDPDTVEANRRYQEALTLLNESLDTRKNRLFDPTLLAMAQGFLAPTQSGSFGESLGNVAKNVGVAQEAESKREQEIAQQRLAVAGQGLELQRLKSRDAELSNYLNPMGPVAGPKAAPVAGPLSGALAGPKATPSPAATTATAAAPAGPLSQGAPAAPAGGGLPALSKADQDKQEDYDRMSRIVATFNTPEHKKKWMESGRGSEEQFINEKNFWEDRLKKMPRPSAPAAAPEVKTIAPQAVTQGPLPTRDKPPGFEGVDGIQVAPPNPNFMSARDYVRLNRFDKSKSPGDLIKEGQEIEQKRYRDKEGGVLDLSTGKFYQYPTGKTEEVQLYGYPGTYSVDARTAARLSMLAANNDPAYYDLAKRVVEGPQKAEGKAGEPSRMKSKQELELEKQKTEKMQAADIEEEIATKKDFTQRSKDAAENIGIANVMRRFTEKPDFKDMTGILNNNKIYAGIATLVRDGIGSKNFTIGVPAIEDVMRNAGLTPEQQATYRTFLMYTAQMQLNAEKAMKGSTTERERLILGNANISPQDTAETVRRKADLITAKGQFDRQAARAFKASKMTAEEFLESEQYLSLYDKYYANIADIASGLKMIASSAATTKPSAAPAAGGVQPSTGFIRDPATGVIRKKKAGE
jgi:hypothetical protein